MCEKEESAVSTSLERINGILKWNQKKVQPRNLDLHWTRFHCSASRVPRDPPGRLATDPLKVPSIIHSIPDPFGFRLASLPT